MEQKYEPILFEKEIEEGETKTISESHSRSGIKYNSNYRTLPKMKSISVYIQHIIRVSHTSTITNQTYHIIIAADIYI